MRQRPNGMGPRKTAKGKARGAGSPTNASDAVDDVMLPSHPTTEEIVDEGVEESFPASDPPAAVQPKRKPHAGARKGEAKPAAPAAPRKRSADWMFEKKS